MFVSDYFQLDDEQLIIMSSLEVFDSIIDKDSNFFINIIRLKESTIQEFIDAYHQINQFFSDIATLLDLADSPSTDDKFYRTARKKFCFHEVNGINLGFSNSKSGRGWGKKLSEKFLMDAYQMVKKGIKQPEIFHLVSLFEEDVGPDRLSDMIATIIEPEIVRYTLRILQELNITPLTRPNLLFDDQGLVQNPYKNVPILLIPKEILHELPIAEEWDDVQNVIIKNEVIRREISSEVGEKWYSWATERKKKYLKEYVFLNPDTSMRIIDGYKQQKLASFDIRNNLEYVVELMFNNLVKSCSLSYKADYPSSLEATRAIIFILKDWVENNRGWAVIQDTPSINREKAVQRLMHLGAKNYVERNNLDFSCEPDEGRGPVDIKLSRGQDKTLAEIKLSSNSRYLHGYRVQINEYSFAERTRSLIYVFIDLGNPVRRKNITNLYNSTKASGKPCPELIIIDATPKKAASTFSESKWEYNVNDWEDIGNIDFGDLSDLDFGDLSDWTFSELSDKEDSNI